MSQAYLVPGLDTVNSAIPLTINGLVQYAMDRPATYGSVVDGYPTITPLERKNPGVPRGARCYLFDGNNDYAVVTNVPTIKTFACWVKSTSVTGTTRIVSCMFNLSGNDLSVINTNGSIELYIGNAAVSGTTTLTSGTVTHFCVTWDGTTAKLYKDGVEVISGTCTPISGTGQIVLGSWVMGNVQFFNGRIWDARVYSVAKTAAEVLAIYNQHLTPTVVDSANLIAAWPCQEESGIVGYDISGNGRNLTLTNITQSTFHATDTGVKWSYPNEKGYTLSGSVVVPASLANPTQDVLGNSLQYIGPIHLPITTEVPCFTGDGTAAYADLGSPLIPASADFSISCWYKVKGTQYAMAFTQGSTYVNNILVWESPNNVFQVYFNNTAYQGTTSFATGSWVFITLSRIGSNFTFSVNGVTELTFTNTAIIGQSNTFLHKLWDGTYGAASVCDLRVTTGGITTYFPLQDGPGSSNTNRNIAYVKSDGTGGVISNALTNGTVSAIWANRCPYGEDWSVKYGGGVSSGVFIPGRIGSSNDAAGNAKTLSAGKVGNPYTRVIPNVWGAPSLNNIGYTSSMKLEEWPCITGNGTNVIVSLGLILPTTADFTASFWLYYTNQSIQETVFSQGALQVYTGGASTNIGLYNGSSTSGLISVPVNSWSYVTVGRSGPNWFLSINGTTLTVPAVSISGTSLRLLALDSGPSQQSTCRISNLQITIDEVTKYFPLSEGNGSDIAYFVDGNFTNIANAISGTLTNVWANKFNGSVSIPYAPEAMLPRNTKFRRTLTDGNDRYTAFINALTGSDLVKMLNYSR